MNEEPYNPRLKKLLLEVVDNQIKANDPPETKNTLKRLMGNGHTRQQARQMIAAVVVEFLYDIMKNGEHFDNEKYCKRLKELK